MEPTPRLNEEPQVNNFTVPVSEQLRAPQLANYHGRAVRVTGTLIGAAAIGIGVYLHSIEAHNAGRESIAAEQAYEQSVTTHNDALRKKSDELVTASHKNRDAGSVPMDIGWGVGSASILIGYFSGGKLHSKEKAENEQRRVNYFTRVEADKVRLAAEAAQKNQ